jgi:tetratricopeptide (TPR) repeat protein
MSEPLAADPRDMAEPWHLSADLFRRFLDQQVSRSERQAVIRHLLTQCPQCLGLAGPIVAEGGYWFGKKVVAGLAEGDRFAASFEAAAAFADRASRRVAFERLRGWAHWSALDPLLPNERLPVVVMQKDWHHWGLFRALLDAARWYSSRDPQEAADIAQLALDIVGLLDPNAVGGEATANDMRAKAWMILGNCRRLASDLEGARAAIAEAWRWNEEGAGDPLDEAAILRADAAYAVTVGEFETAETILEKALTLYLAVGDAHHQGRTLIQLANAVGHLDPEKGLSHIGHALELINPVREPRLGLCAQHDLAWFLCAAGRPQDALGVLDRARLLYQQFPDEWAQLRFHWLQGQVARSLGRFVDAAHILRQVREEFCARDLHRDFLMISIDLAEVYVAAGEMATTLRLLTEVTPILTRWNAHRNALAAWLTFQKALEERRDLGAVALYPLFESVRLYYRRYWHVPAAEFAIP